MEYFLDGDGLVTELDYGTLRISGDEQLGFRPFQLMVSSIVGCSSLVFRNILEKQRIEYRELRIKADVERNEEAYNRIEKITLHFYISGDNLDQQKLAKSLEVASKNCAMVRSVAESIEVVEKISVES